MNGIKTLDEPRADVVVGVDGSEPSIQALLWALRVAEEHHWTLEVVTAWPGADVLQVHDVPGHFSAPRQHAFDAQDAALDQVRATLGDGRPMHATVVNAHPVEALAARAASARLLVTGGRWDVRPTNGHPRRAPVGESVASLVHCPVAVVHEADSPTTRRS